MNKNYTLIIREIDTIHSKRRELNTRENILHKEITRLLK